MICPDIYFPNFIEWAGRYLRNGNPLFIPEMAPSARAPGNAVYAIAQLGYRRNLAPVEPAGLFQQHPPRSGFQQPDGCGAQRRDADG